MRLGQIHHRGAICAAIFENGRARPMTGRTTLDILRDPGLTRSAGNPLDTWEPALPIHPPEVWGCGCTYETSASFRDAEHGWRIVAMIWDNERDGVEIPGDLMATVAQR